LFEDNDVFLMPLLDVGDFLFEYLLRGGESEEPFLGCLDPSDLRSLLDVGYGLDPFVILCVECWDV
jgi:hypothetical protein